MEKLSIPDLKDAVKKAEAEHLELTYNLAKMKQELAEAICPFKEGETVELYPSNSFFGATRAVIKKVTPPSYGDGGYGLRVLPFKKDGTPSARESTIYPDGIEKLEKVNNRTRNA